jgi:P27 family predicted phage terminase small subunit
MPAHRKPTALKLLHGNRKSAINQNEPRFGGAPKCPEWLHPLAKREWKRVMTEFRDTGLVTAADQAALASYCQSYARWRQAEEQIESEGQLIREPIVTRSGNVSGYRTKKHPAVTVAKDERAAMLTAGRLFGMTPASRSSIHAPEPEQPIEDDDDDDIFVH